ncbi:MAG: glycine zipper domain-containing protein [Magnetospirillum sp.]
MFSKGQKIGLAMALVATLGGCVTTDQDQTRLEGALAGAAVGAAAGAATGRGNAVLVGAVIGAGVGLMAGEYIAQRKQEYVDARAMVEGETEWVRQLTATTALENDNLKNRLTLIDRDIAALQKKKKTNKISQDEVGATLKKILTLREAEEKKLKVAKEEYKTQEALLADAKKENVEEPKLVLMRAQLDAYANAISVTQDQINRINDQQNSVLLTYRS